MSIMGKSKRIPLKLDKSSNISLLTTLIIIIGMLAELGFYCWFYVYLPLKTYTDEGYSTSYAAGKVDLVDKSVIIIMIIVSYGAFALYTGYISKRKNQVKEMIVFFIIACIYDLYMGATRLYIYLNYYVKLYKIWDGVDGTNHIIVETSFILLRFFFVIDLILLALYITRIIKKRIIINIYCLIVSIYAIVIILYPLCTYSLKPVARISYCSLFIEFMAKMLVTYMLVCNLEPQTEVGLKVIDDIIANEEERLKEESNSEEDKPDEDDESKKIEDIENTEKAEDSEEEAEEPEDKEDSKEESEESEDKEDSKEEAEEPEDKEDSEEEAEEPEDKEDSEEEAEEPEGKEDSEEETEEPEDKEDSEEETEELEDKEDSEEETEEAEDKEDSEEETEEAEDKEDSEEETKEPEDKEDSEDSEEEAKESEDKEDLTEK